ncbi:CCA tRNA nucleotidyltransferase [Aestuariibius sp. HNIBRBA575]|uniref:CCA tRNA nucleotidyltransferase n=1 Tax=Aestuariibius sp. HNIBRBA575 TaxID=3233343 RepID=UPI0034A41701
MTQITAEWLTSDTSQRVCAMLENAGYQAWFVGGCVRNALLGEPVNDLDISTDAHPETVIKLAQSAGFNAVPTGIDHGTITVIANHIPYEITTFRRDVETDGRRAVVAFAKTLTEDAHRRDFTMNALYADARGQIADPLDGIPDLNARIFRFIDDPNARIREDYLRILRFFRFHAWYGDPGAGLDPDGLAACAEHVEGIAKLSKERIGAELRKLFLAKDPAPATASMAACGALMQALPGAAPDLLAVLVHVEQQAEIGPDWIRRLAIIGGQDVTLNLRLSRKEAKNLSVIQGGLGAMQSAMELGYRHGADRAIDILLIRAAMSGQEVQPDLIEEAKLGAAQVFPLVAADLPSSLKGPEIGDTLRRAEQAWIASGMSLDKTTLLSNT